MYDESTQAEWGTFCYKVSRGFLWSLLQHPNLHTDTLKGDSDEEPAVRGTMMGLPDVRRDSDVRGILMGSCM